MKMIEVVAAIIERDGKILLAQRPAQSDQAGLWEFAGGKVELDESMQVQALRGDLLHTPYRDLEHYLVKSARYGKAWADGRAARGKRGSLLQGFGHAIGCFLRMYVLRLGFLCGGAGFLYCLFIGLEAFFRYAVLFYDRDTLTDRAGR